MEQDVIRVKALSHPLRMDIMKVYSKTGEPTPIKKVAEILKQPPAKLHYHFKQLEAAGFLKVVSTREINGITERYYQGTGLDLDISLSIKDQPDAVAALMPSIQRKTLAAIRRIQQLDPERVSTGIGSFSEFTLSRDKASALKSSILDFLKHKPAQLPEEDEEGDGDIYDFIVLLVPRDNDL